MTTTTTAQAAAADERVATYDIADIVVPLGCNLLQGIGYAVDIEPGDCTRYILRVAPRTVRDRLDPGASIATFGTSSDRVTVEWGHAIESSPEHPVTAALWRRIVREASEVVWGEA